MSFTNGVFRRTDGLRAGSNLWAQAKAAGARLCASYFDTHGQNVADGLSQCVLKDGTQTITADIPFNGKKITGLGAGVGSTDLASVQDVIDAIGSRIKGIHTVVADTQLAGPAPFAGGLYEGVNIGTVSDTTQNFYFQLPTVLTAGMEVWLVLNCNNHRWGAVDVGSGAISINGKPDGRVYFDVSECQRGIACYFIAVDSTHWIGGKLYS